MNCSAVQCSVVVFCTALPCTATNIAALSNNVHNNTALSNNVQNSTATKCTSIHHHYDSPLFFLYSLNDICTIIKIIIFCEVPIFFLLIYWAALSGLVQISGLFLKLVHCTAWTELHCTGLPWTSVQYNKVKWIKSKR